MFHILLYQPEIPPNTGNILRLCANTGSTLHLIEPFGFTLDDKRLKRAGLDYINRDLIYKYKNLLTCLEKNQFKQVFALSTKGQFPHTTPNFKPGDAFLFGPETRGLPESILKSFAPQNILRIPMVKVSRSLNLANAVAIQIYEAWRQNNFLFSES